MNFYAYNGIPQDLCPSELDPRYMYIFFQSFEKALGGKIPSCLTITQCILLISKKGMKKRRITLATWLDSFNKPCNYQLIFSFYPKVTFCLLKCGWISEINEMIISVFFCLWKLFYSFPSRGKTLSAMHMLEKIKEK